MPTTIPTQNDWIHTLHSRGVEDFDSFIPTFLVSTAGMASGLSLGPELPLLLTAGMVGSWLGILCRQSMLQARVMNLTAASAAIGGFFGFPMAGAIFVLEVPHRMGLQYFEALSPSTIASIVAVLINRILVNNDVTGMFQYPFLNESLPSSIFGQAIIYGLYGCLLGVAYTLGVKKLKTGVHHLFDEGDHASQTETSNDTPASPAECTPLIGDLHPFDQKVSSKIGHKGFTMSFTRWIPHEPTRAAVTGTLAGIAVGITGMFLPHVMFWGEAQLQTMIDQGRTPLPIFQDDGPTAALAAKAFCMVSQDDDSGFSLSCSAVIILAKIFTTGVSLGTGIVGGQFWSPLLVGCAGSHFFSEIMNHLSASFGTSFSLAQYPCVALLCIMGSTYV
jgi:H+/Cl- antiporter ClcA